MKPCTDYRQAIQTLHSRRDVLRGFARLAVAGIGSSLFPSLIPRVAFGAGPANAQREVIVCVFLRGGADGLSFVAPYTESLYYSNRPTLAIPSPDSTDPLKGLKLDPQFALHPSLAGFHELYTAGSLAVVHGTGSIDPTRSHFDAMRYMEQATPGNKSIASGWLARHLVSEAVQNASPLRAIGFGGLVQTSLRGAPGLSPIAIDNIDDFGLDVGDDQAVAMQTALERLYGTVNPSNILGAQAKLVFDTINQLGNIDLANYVPANNALYPEESELALGLKQTALLIKADLGLEVACVDIGDWDTHENAGTNDGYLRDHLKEFGDSLAAFVKDMGDAMAHVTVITMSEFGRRVQENASKGLDHGHGNVMFIAGGGVNGGQVYADWKTLADLDDGDLQVTIDQRVVLWELLSKRIGSTAFTQTFPNFGGAPPPTLGIFKG
ncbi:MAG TPA: DUF1501 domain-containing protein [Chthoniobacteraceae bacterium]|jgi:uncharacterized protein (DUF1501 family)|nr:DUF1501 domain-containing protein [Chthoniobacteraceae bacterium]